MSYIVVFKCPHHVGDGVGLADMGEKLVAQPLSLSGTLHQAGNIHQFHGRGQHLLGLHDLRERGEPRIRDRHDPHIGIDGAEGIVLRRNLRRREGVEQGGLAHVR